ncbi:chemotaxis protein [Tepidimonas taiwanensis]|uniref:Chemotaxis protein CheV n=1 Tax=Tepidimonas taiwanensis TaxID=307486 RepID=A0A554XDW5_9BURK|nr:chemotaxis protein [Tepidimonas taiwanensis]MCX7691841.1 chemotaxis protein [Tepidimonas taiwanensis]MDM7463374.1 chemotaxis protein [Tepidimonas taiwanensis]TSE34031.1 Chemotaxis protein CheV [Tepidimonas taiwanensis]UBQ04993.1 chemotaxis protein [Tepidimonas taiwanensis]
MSSTAFQKEVDERTNLTGSNKFEMLLFRLGRAPGSGQSELFGINVFKVREIVAMPALTAMAGAPQHVLGMVNLRGQVIPVIDLPAVIGCTPETGLNLMLVTEFARTTQAFAAESVEDIVRLDWGKILPADHTASVARGLVTSIARLDDGQGGVKLVQILDVESILQRVMPSESIEVKKEDVGTGPMLKPGAVVLAADDSFVARTMIEQELKTLGLPFIMTKNGQEAWATLQDLAADCKAKGVPVTDRVAVVLSDLEMPEMDGFTLTRQIKGDPTLRTIPVVIHSSLTGDTNEQHVQRAGADGYVAKFAAKELADTLRQVLSRSPATV